MAQGSQTLTTYYAKRIIGDTAAANADSALLQTGTNITTNTWILNQTKRLENSTSKTYGIKYVYDGTNDHDKIEFHGKTSSDNATAWIQLDTGDFSIIGSASFGDLSVTGDTSIGGDLSITGASKFGGHIYLTGTAATTDSTTTQIVFTNSNASSQYASISCNTGGALVINPSSSSTTGQIILHPGSISAFTSGTLAINAAEQSDYTLYVNGTTWHTDHIYLAAAKHIHMSYNSTNYYILHNHNNGNVSVNAASAGLYMAYYNTTFVNWMNGRMELRDGCLSLFPNNSSYREGIRIHATGSWSDITLCGNDNTGNSGTSANSWFLGNNNGNFYIARNGSPGSTAYLSCVSNAWTFLNKVRIASTEDVNLGANGAFIIGATNSTNIGIDDNEIMARNNSAASTLYLNSEGGQVYVGSGGLSVQGQIYGTWLRIVNNSSNNSDDAMVYLENQNNSDWGMKINCEGYDYGLYVQAADASNAIKTTGQISAWRIWANQGSNGERLIGVDSETSGRLYLFANTSAKGIYSSTGYRTGFIIKCDSTATTFYGDCTGNAATATNVAWTGVTSKPLYTRSSVGDLGWSTYKDYVIMNSAMAYWNGCYSGTSSNLQYCDRGRFGTIVTKATTDYRASTAPASGAWFTGTPTISSGGVMEIGRYIDFHTTNTSTADYDFRLDNSAAGQLVGSGTLALVNNSQNNATYNALLYIEHKSGNDWGIIINKNSASDYGMSITCTSTGSHGIDVVGRITGTKVYGAVWNDYAEYRTGEILEGGYCVHECSDGIMRKSDKRLEAGCRVTSDTFGFAIGETEKCKTPIAVSGRVLVYPYRDRKEYKLGDAVCSAPDGKIDIMSRDEIIKYPERIIGTVSEIPDYDIWECGEGKDDVLNHKKVNGRIWIYVR